MKLTKLSTCLLLLISASIAISNVYSQNCPSGLLSYWKMDESNSIALSDYVSSITATGNVVLDNDENGIVGSAKIFNGANNIDIPDKVGYNFKTNSSFSFELWAKLPPASIGNQVIIGKNDAQGKGALWYIGVENGIPFFYLRDSSTVSIPQYITSTNAINNGNWHHIVAVRDEATNNNFLYVDGIIVSQTTYDYPSNFTTSAIITIGYLLKKASPDYYFTGSLDEIAIYNRALSQTEIIFHYTNGILGIGYCDKFCPNIISTPKNKAVVGNTYTYTVKAIGLPIMTYSLLAGPSGMEISSTGIISWKPDSSNINALVCVRVDNGISPADTQSFNIYISEPPVCPSNLISLLKLNETNGPIYADFYNSHNAIASVSPTPTKGKINGGQLFNDTTKLDIPDIASEFDWSSSASFSFELWMKTSSTADMICLGRNRTDSAHVASWLVGAMSGKAFFELVDNSGSKMVLNGSSNVSDNQWHQMIAVRNGSTGTNKLYVDGVEEASKSIVYKKSFKAYDPLVVSVGYMKRNEGYPEYHFKGALDEIAIFNYAVTSKEAASYYNGGLPNGHCAERNFTPAILSTPITSAIESEEYSYKLIAIDIDTADDLTYRAVSIPDWLNFSPEDGLLTGTPTHNDTGENNIVINISDGTTSINQEFKITVLGVTAVTEINSNNYVIFPVPVKDELKIKFNNISEETDINIINSTGSIIESIIVHANTELINIPVNHIEAGFYICHIRNNTINATSRFLIIR